ncbi:MAG: kynureninase [Planctomycetes bacterium]|nr:kynureninase [Planctomycetota bacterium]
MKAEDLFRSPNAIAADYSRFGVAERLLLSGHSHQAWPDCSFAAQQQAWLDAAECVDEKWERAFAKTDEVRRGYARLMDDPVGEIALGHNTAELVIRLLSALPLKTRGKIVTTDGEFHSLRRLTDRLAEEWLEIVKVPSAAAEQIAARLADAVDDRTAAVFVSSVLFQNARIVPGLSELATVCQRHGAELVIDAYHHLNVVPFSIVGLESAFVLGGGYKYCQLGEGNCALRLPPDCQLRPVTTGWYAEFAALTGVHQPGEVLYGEGANRFAGATYDPCSNYRAAAVFDYFAQRELSPSLLREVSQHQIGLIVDAFDRLDLDPTFVRRKYDGPLSEIGGFVAVVSPQADDICRRLKSAGVFTDSRDNILRIGPAPYLCDDQIRDAMDRFGQVCRALQHEAG